MSTSTFNPAPTNAMCEWAGRLASEVSHSVFASRSVRADRARIFQAITVPEYMETWFSAPGLIPGYVRVFGDDSSFSICGATENGSTFKVSCTYRVCRRSKLVFNWRQDPFLKAIPSVVRIRLQGDFERTTVDVLHTGISEYERKWCGVLWEASLEKLSRLF